MSARLIVIAAGGTGGHMFPAQALAEAMLAKGWRVKLSTDERGARYTENFPDEVEIVRLSSATFSRGDIVDKLTAPFQLIAGVFSAAMSFFQDRPDIVVGFGGYPSFPAIAAAKIMRLPSMIHEQNGVLGRVNRLFARSVDRVACGIWPTELPDGANDAFTGNPVRRAVLERAGAAYIPPGIYPLSVVVIGGSQGARILSQVVPDAVALLPAEMRSRIRVAHQARAEDAEHAKRAYSDHGISAEVLPFFEDVPRRFSEAQLIISRAGASSVADLAVIGRPSILVPYAAATADHQTANARGLVHAGGAVMIPESKFKPKALAEQMTTIMINPEAASAMAAAALSTGRPDATEALVALVEELTGVDEEE